MQVPLAAVRLHVPGRRARARAGRPRASGVPARLRCSAGARGAVRRLVLGRIARPRLPVRSRSVERCISRLRRRRRGEQRRQGHDGDRRHVVVQLQDADRRAHVGCNREDADDRRHGVLGRKHGVRSGGAVERHLRRRRRDLPERLVPDASDADLLDVHERWRLQLLQLEHRRGHPLRRHRRSSNFSSCTACGVVMEQSSQFQGALLPTTAWVSRTTRTSRGRWCRRRS